MSSDASRHSEAMNRHEEHLNMVRPDGTRDPVWKILTKPVASVEEALLKLNSVNEGSPKLIYLKLRTSHHEGALTPKQKSSRGRENMRKLPGPGVIMALVSRN